MNFKYLTQNWSQSCRTCFTDMFHTRASILTVIEYLNGSEYSQHLAGQVGEGGGDIVTWAWPRPSGWEFRASNPQLLLINLPTQMQTDWEVTRKAFKTTNAWKKNSKFRLHVRSIYMKPNINIHPEGVCSIACRNERMHNFRTHKVPTTHRGGQSRTESHGCQPIASASVYTMLGLTGAKVLLSGWTASFNPLSLRQTDYPTLQDTWEATP